MNECVWVPELELARGLGYQGATRWAIYARSARDAEKQCRGFYTCSPVKLASEPVKIRSLTCANVTRRQPRKPTLAIQFKAISRSGEDWKAARRHGVVHITRHKDPGRWSFAASLGKRPAGRPPAWQRSPARLGKPRAPTRVSSASLSTASSSSSTSRNVCSQGGRRRLAPLTAGGHLSRPA